MGANIGTTITAQIAALNSLPINEIFILLLGVGVFMEMFSKKEKVKSAGLALAGLGIVFLGLEVMSGAMGQYAEVVEIKNFLSTMTNPLVLLLFGILFTTLMQSSSAVTTIIIAMASSGLVTHAVDKPGIVVAFHKIFMIDQFLLERLSGFDTLNGQFTQSPAADRNSFLTVSPPDDDLGDQTVVVGGDPVAGVNMAVHPDIAAARRHKKGHLTG